MAKSKKEFEVEVEGKLRVLAFDEASARKKAVAALGPRALTDDVAATGHVWTYAVTRQPPVEAAPAG